jgi:hypothetical protein
MPGAADAEVKTALETKARRRSPLVKRAPPPDRQACPRRAPADWPSDPLRFIVESAVTPVALEPWARMRLLQKHTPCQTAVRPRISLF